MMSGLVTRFGCCRRVQPNKTGADCDMTDFRDVDPRELRPASSRRDGADPIKLHRQIARFGASTDGMPPLIVYEASDGVLVIYNGVTRATRIAKLAPGTK